MLALALLDTVTPHELFSNNDMFFINNASTIQQIAYTCETWRDQIHSPSSRNNIMHSDVDSMSLASRVDSRNRY